MSLRPRSVLVSRPYHLRRICSLFLLDGEFPKCQLDQLDGWCYSVQQYPYWFSACLINQLLREDVEEANHRSGFIYFSLQFKWILYPSPHFKSFLAKYLTIQDSLNALSVTHAHLCSGACMSELTWISMLSWFSLSFTKAVWIIFKFDFYHHFVTDLQLLYWNNFLLKVAMQELGRWLRS